MQVLVEQELVEEMQDLAQDVAKELVPVKQILESRGLTEEEYSRIKAIPEYKDILQEEKAKWLSPENTNERIKAKGRYVVEDGMLSMSAIMKDPNVNPMVRIKAYSEIIRVAGADNAAVAKSAAAGGGGGDAREGISISINIGGQREQISGFVPERASGETIDAHFSSETEGVSERHGGEEPSLIVDW